VQITTDKDELRRALAEKQGSHVRCRSFRTGLEALDEIAPNAAFQGGAVHELLWPRQSTYPKSLALLLAKAAQKNGGAIAWSDPDRELHLPALSAAGINLRNLVLLRCANRADQLWALAQCLRCRGVGATVAFIQRLSQIEARRLQLAAERGGGVGLFMRPYAPGISNYYAAATRWLIPRSDGTKLRTRYRHLDFDNLWNGRKVIGHQRRRSQPWVRHHRHRRRFTVFAAAKSECGEE
jgi:protein ImuA